MLHNNIACLLKPIILFALLAISSTAIATSTTPLVDYPIDSITQSGDIIQIMIPSIALAETYYLHDSIGQSFFMSLSWQPPL